MALECRCLSTAHKCQTIVKELFKVEPSSFKLNLSWEMNTKLNIKPNHGPQVIEHLIVHGDVVLNG